MSITKSPIRVSGTSSYFKLFRLDCASLTAPGSGRAQSEDHCLFAAPGNPVAEQSAAGYLFAVVDGDSQTPNGRKAAREIGNSLLEVLDDPRRLELRPDLIMHRLMDANDRCHQFLKGRAAVSALWIWEEGASLLAGWAHVGDTRLGLHRDGRWRQITRDHAKGKLLDRAVGQGPGLTVDSGRLELRSGDRLALMSDGVWRTAPIGSVVSGEPLPTTPDAVRRLIGEARLNGSPGDTTAIVIAVQPIDAAPEPEH